MFVTRCDVDSVARACIRIPAEAGLAVTLFLTFSLWRAFRAVLRVITGDEYYSLFTILFGILFVLAEIL